MESQCSDLGTSNRFFIQKSVLTKSKSEKEILLLCGKNIITNQYATISKINS